MKNKEQIEREAKRFKNLALIERYKEGYGFITKDWESHELHYFSQKGDEMYLVNIQGDTIHSSEIKL